MPCVGFEPMIPTSELAKTVHALDRSATATGLISVTILHLPRGVEENHERFKSG
jgi:hypothetical protein